MASYSESVSHGYIEPEYQETQTFDAHTPTSDHSQLDFQDLKDVQSSKAFSKFAQSSGFSPPQARSLPLDLSSFTNESSQLWATALDFTNALRDMEVPGPLDLTENPYKFIARGGQFAVYHNAISGWRSDDPSDIHYVVVKRCLIELKHGEVLDLNVLRTRRQVHNMYLEVLALQDKTLKHHRNIVKLLGWSFEAGYNAMPLLVMEVAAGDLADFLTQIDSKPAHVRHQICLDMCAGLSALHSSGIVHADLKPKNILIFRNDWDAVPFIAKLADFGFSALEAGTIDTASMAISGWSEGWQAPEIDSIHAQGNRGKITVAEYYQADKYSLGLVVWSTFCNSGKHLEDNTKPDASARAIEAMEAQKDVPPLLKHTISSALGLLLSYEPSARPADLASLLCDAKDCEYLESIRDNSAGTQAISPDDEFAPQNISRFFVQTLDKAFKDFGDTMSGGELFSIFLHRSYASIRDDNISVNSSFIRALLLAAEKNFVPAQAIAYLVLQSHNIEWPGHLEAKKISWLYEGASIGCKIALVDLESLDHEKATEARQTFRARGGLLQLYVTLQERDIWKKAVQGASLNSQPGEAEGIGQLKITNLSLSESEVENTTHPDRSALQTDAQDFGTKREDLLYLAYVAGSTGLVQRLCAQGCDASVTRTPHAISCLHWLFTFPSEDVDDIAATLIRNGALVNAQLNTALPIRNVNFPYSLPPGTPLHWATASSNIPAVLTLLKHGADLGIRNGEDPYKHNKDVRELLKESKDYTVGAYSVPTQPCQGLTALDLAAANHDWKLLQAISELKGAITPVSGADEEGSTAFHRLERNWIGRTWASSRFWYASFAGSDQPSHEPLILTIEVLVAMGGNINQLTSLSASNATKAYFPGNMTPLMLAVRWMDLAVIKALLACGADLNVRNEHGLNALSMLPERGSPEVLLRNVQAVCDLLIQHETEVTAPLDCFGGLDPLACAVQCTDLGVVRALLKAGASTKKNQDVSVAAWLMVELPVQEFLAGSNFTRQDWDWRCDSIIEIVREYFLGGAEAESSQLYNVDPQGGSLLHYAVTSGSLGVVKYLLAQDIKPNVYRQKIKRIPKGNVRGVLFSMPFGTPLDVCVRKIEQLKIDSGLNHLNISPQSYTVILNCYHDIQEILEKKGGRLSDVALEITRPGVLQVEPAPK